MTSRGLSVPQLALLLGVLLVALFSVSVLSAWSGPSAPPPSGNLSAPVNAGTVAQVKSGALSTDAFGVFGNAIVSGSAVSYINFGDDAGQAGYGLRNNNGVMQFKHEGGEWLDFCTNCNN